MTSHKSGLATKTVSNGGLQSQSFMTNFFTQRLAGTSEAETSVSRKLKLNFLTIGEDQKSKLSGVACLIYLIYTTQITKWELT